MGNSKLRVRRPYTTGQAVLLTCIAILLSLGVVAFGQLFGIARQERRASKAREVLAQADLSRPGVYLDDQASFYAAGFGQSICLRVPSGTLKHRSARALLDGLEAELIVTTPQGRQVHRTALSGKKAGTPGIDEGMIHLSSLPDDLNGEHELTLTITQGAPLLADVEHALELHNVFYLEGILVVLCFGGSGALSFILAIILGLILAFWRRRSVKSATEDS